MADCAFDSRVTAWTGNLALLWQIFAADERDGIERSRCRGIEVVAGVGVPAASSSVAGALAMNRPVQSDQRWINDDGDQQDLDTCKRR